MSSPADVWNEDVYHNTLPEFVVYPKKKKSFLIVGALVLLFLMFKNS